MSPLTRSVFEKERQCPSSEVLVSYQQRDLTGGQTSAITVHLASCDFCAAELLLLAKYPGARESQVIPPMPVNLRALAEALLNRNRPGSKHLLEKMF